MSACWSAAKAAADLVSRNGTRRDCVIALVFFLLWPLFAGADNSGQSSAGESALETTDSIAVFYLTNRLRVPGKTTADSYTGERGETRFGRCRVDFTPIPLISQFAPQLPFHLQRETHRISLREQTDPDLFWDQLTKAAENKSSGSVVLFVHGYNYGFERTCRMAAEIQRALLGHATLLMFSWPSNGLAADYVRDQADIEWSVPLLAGLIEQLGDRLGREQVQVVAHSLGSRGVLFALQQLAAERNERPAVGNLVLLAPDFDAQTFSDRFPALRPMSARITLYASSNDAPLWASRQLSGYPRLGEGGELLTVIEGMETIDVSSLGRYQFTGHEYFYFHPRVKADLVELLSSNAGADQRPGLHAEARNGTRYWTFTETGGPADTMPPR